METVKDAGIPVEKSKVLFEDAYQRLLPEMQSLSADELLSVNLDIPSAVATVLGVQPELDALGDKIRTLTDLDVERVVNVGLYARALAQAHSLYVMALEPSDTLKALTEEGTALRDILIGDANALARRKLMNTERLRELTGPIGYKNLAFDLQHLVNLFEANFAKIQGKSGTQKSELVRAQEIAAGIIELVGLREQAAARIAEASDVRARAFTLFLRTYDEARRAVSYLRWHKTDVNHITPSLYAGKGRKKDERSEDPPAVPVTAPPAADHGVVPATDMLSPTATSAAAPQPAAPANPQVGTPTASPFLS